MISKTENEDLLVLLSRAKELINTYDNFESLIYVDFLKVLRTTSRKSRKKMKLKSLWFNYEVHWLLMNSAGGTKGGFLVSILFRRRAGIVFKAILSTCNLYLTNQPYSENSKIVEKIIELVRNKQKSMSKIKDESAEKISGILKQITFILGIPLIASFVWERAVVPALDKVQLSYLQEAFGSLLSLIIFYSVMIIIFYVVPKIKWYRILVKITRTKDKETDIYDSLIPIERIILSRFFPKIESRLDER